MPQLCVDSAMAVVQAMGNQVLGSGRHRRIGCVGAAGGGGGGGGSSSSAVVSGATGAQQRVACRGVVEDAALGAAVRGAGRVGLVRVVVGVGGVFEAGDESGVVVPLGGLGRVAVFQAGGGGGPVEAGHGVVGAAGHADELAVLAHGEAEAGEGVVLEAGERVEAVELGVGRVAGEVVVGAEVDGWLKCARDGDVAAVEVKIIGIVGVGGIG